MTAPAAPHPQEVAELKEQLEIAIRGLEKIASMDYRGHPSMEQHVAQETLLAIQLAR